MFLHSVMSTKSTWLMDMLAVIDKVLSCGCPMASKSCTVRSTYLVLGTFVGSCCTTKDLQPGSRQLLHLLQLLLPRSTGLAPRHLRLALCIVATPTILPAGALSRYTGSQHEAHSQLTEPANYVHIESDLTLLGFAGLMDPPRPEVRNAVRDCQLAGIRVRLHLFPIQRCRL